MDLSAQDREAIDKIAQSSKQTAIDLRGARLRRTSSRFCLGVEHGDYNGTELFGVGTDRFIWLAYKPSSGRRFRLFSTNFPRDGVIEFALGGVPEPRSCCIAQTWGRFAFGVEYILRRAGYKLNCGIDGVIYGDIPGGGMSRSASLTVNLILSLLDANGINVEDRFRIVDFAQAVENEYIGSPCGQLDQIMILFAREGMGTHYNPRTKAVRYIALGPAAVDFCIVSLDTGTVRPGLEKSTYKVRRAECEQLVGLCQQAGFGISCLADVRERALYDQIIGRFGTAEPDLCDRLKYIYHAQQRFGQMLEAWKQGDIKTVGRIFRQDGVGLRDDYKISGPELETMCDIARTVPGVFGERMLGGGDKGAAGALAAADSVKTLKQAVELAYPRSHPDYADGYAVHVCRLVEGIRVYERLFV